jgi:hypothetical protein
MHVNSCYIIVTVLSIDSILCSMLRIDRRPNGGACGLVLIDQKEWEVVEMVRARSDIWILQHCTPHCVSQLN